MKRLIKVCGMRQLDQMKALDKLDVDLLGMIFYGKSPRYVQFDRNERGLLKSIKTPKVGVFVKEQIEQVLSVVEDYSLDFVQLHSGEDLDYCVGLKRFLGSTRIIKVFSVDQDTDFGNCDEFQEVADFFLFDTSSTQYGGSGRKFPWEVLNRYHCDMPFFLSGGLKPGDEEQLNNIRHKNLIGLDLNSGFEIEAAKKDLNLVAEFVKQVA